MVAGASAGAASLAGTKKWCQDGTAGALGAREMAGGRRAGTHGPAQLPLTRGPLALRRSAAGSRTAHDAQEHAAAAPACRDDCWGASLRGVRGATVTAHRRARSLCEVTAGGRTTTGPSLCPCAKCLSTPQAVRHSWTAACCMDVQTWQAAGRMQAYRRRNVRGSQREPAGSNQAPHRQACCGMRAGRRREQRCSRGAPAVHSSDAKRRELRAGMGDCAHPVMPYERLVIHDALICVRQQPPAAPGRTLDMRDVAAGAELGGAASAACNRQLHEWG